MTECCSARWCWTYALIKPHSLRCNEFKSLNGVNNVTMHTISKNVNGWKQIKWQLNETCKALLKIQKCKMNWTEESERSNVLSCTAEKPERSNVLQCTAEKPGSWNQKLNDAELHYLKKQSAEIHCYKSWNLNCNTVKAGR